ncbi:MAG: tyrosine-type recombinase/integrase [Actinomycetota bacterium]|nr:tyrosine-type recombinase/integrase [Actinomycetota bacterium]
MIPTPNMDASDAWAYAWTGFELDQRSRNRSPNTISNRRCSYFIMARHATHDELADPDQVTRAWLQSYLLRQREGRKGNGFTSLWEDLRAFWKWWADQYEKPSPMTKIPRPSTVVTAVPVLDPDEISAILKACGGRDFDPLRNRAIILTLLDSGLRRFELAALTLDDVDVKERIISVRHGKGDKARLTTIGDSACQAIWAYLRAREQRTHETQPALFVSRNGARLSAGGVGQIITRSARSSREWARRPACRICIRTSSATRGRTTSWKPACRSMTLCSSRAGQRLSR